jgi:hypothetical protein
MASPKNHEFVILSEESRKGLNFDPPAGYSVRDLPDNFEIGIRLDRDPNEVDMALWVKKIYDNPTSFSEMAANGIWMPLYTKDSVVNRTVHVASKEEVQSDNDDSDNDDDEDDNDDIDYKIKEVNKPKKLSYEEYDYGLTISKLLAKPRNSKKPHQRDYQKDRKEIKSQVTDFTNIGRKDIFCPHGIVHDDQWCSKCYGPLSFEYDTYEDEMDDWLVYDSYECEVYDSYQSEVYDSYECEVYDSYECECYLSDDRSSTDEYTHDSSGYSEDYY